MCAPVGGLLNVQTNRLLPTIGRMGARARLHSFVSRGGAVGWLPKVPRRAATDRVAYQSRTIQAFIRVLVQRRSLELTRVPTDYQCSMKLTDFLMRLVRTFSKGFWSKVKVLSVRSTLVVGA